MEGAEALHRLVSAFTEAAEAVAGRIFAEQHLPAVERTVKPISAGGVAGGVKFIRDGIFFKVAADEHGIYASEYNAQKVALLYAPRLVRAVAYEQLTGCLQRVCCAGDAVGAAPREARAAIPRATHDSHSKSWAHADCIFDPAYRACSDAMLRKVRRKCLPVSHSRMQSRCRRDD